MDDKNICSKIIKQVCKEILLPLGVFQKGTSRVYLDDNDYFFTVVEFQPSNWDNGTYLNIGLTFLWGDKGPDVLYFAFSRQPAARYGKFVEYKDETQFRNEILNLANIVKAEILFYRKLRDPEFAKKWMISYIEKFKEQKYARFGLDATNICLLNNDTKLAKFYYENYHRERDEEINYKNLSAEYVNSAIKATRKMWHSKSSMGKMPFSKIYDR